MCSSATTISVPKQGFGSRIDRRKHDEDLAERIFGGIRSDRSKRSANERAMASHRTSPPRPRRARHKR
jgi:hypothetical protein